MLSLTPHPLLTFDGEAVTAWADQLVTEEPLELRLVAGEEERPVSVTMRTPGHDEELVLGLLYAEGVIEQASDVLAMAPWCEGDQTQPNVMRLQLRSGLEALAALSRHTFTSSACGVCGTGSIERLAMRAAPGVWTAGPLTPELICDLPRRLGEQQVLFSATGALHGAGLFTPQGEALVVREDVGRHNAVDKLVGWALKRKLLPLTNHVLVVSGRVGFEIAQKAAMAGLSVICAVSAPSSLAVAVAESFGITLVGFTRTRRFNVYSLPERLSLPGVTGPAVSHS
ncbi:formate dehydrogenase accessory sulfurtransferase FdhD (plasmid) [Deinococcus taeanensis]|uniref:formate dehydrogenase accessory sulfurtransferase FdhD n=1 Tax=Deinococcus taeanensis TaxID=2737050 RepID=UPI001CDBF357|nr:formate dehydrogenase accessory sulfurtransferase FdhD [Deinococcus taeanensis]UBV45454.1 formate dehydrogenase accessory sulfurtransferase FdhD [Deinococcus taeanensis]